MLVFLILIQLKYGYVRASTFSKDLESQLHILKMELQLKFSKKSLQIQKQIDYN